MEQQYLDSIRKILSEGSHHDDRTGTGTIRVFSEVFRYDLSQNLFPIFTTRKLSLRIAAEELVWMLSGSTNNKLLQDKNIHIWDGNSSLSECAKFNRSKNDLGPIYGHQWRNYNATKRTCALTDDVYDISNKKWINRAYNNDGFDQIKNIIDMIQNNPNSRRIIVNSFHPVEASQVNPPPCHSFFQIQVDSDRINLILLQRSGDFFLGIPTNTIFYSLLTLLIATVTGKKPGVFVHNIVDAHIYKDHIEQCKELLKRNPLPLPELKINSRLLNSGFNGLLDFKYSDLELINYQSHPPLRAKMSV